MLRGFCPSLEVLDKLCEGGRVLTDAVAGAALDLQAVG